MASEKNPYSEMSKELLELSLIDVFVLQRLDILKTPMLRYQLMQDTHTAFPFVSTAKFYRILDKFEKYSLVITSDKEYILSDLGLEYLTQAKRLLDHRGFSIFQYLSSEFPSMFDLMDISGERVLIYDYEELFEPAFLGLLLKEVDSLYTIYREEIFNYFKKTYPNLKRIPTQDKTLMTPNDFFDSVSVTFHTNIMTEIAELTRVLKTGGKLFITEIESQKSDFLLHNVLFELYAPKHLKKDKIFLDLNKTIQNGSYSLDTKYEFEGLRMFKLIKN